MWKLFEWTQLKKRKFRAVKFQTGFQSSVLGSLLQHDPTLNFQSDRQNTDEILYLYAWWKGRRK